MRGALVGATVFVALLAGCGKAPEIGSPPAPDAFEKRAETVAQAWKTAGIGDAFVPLEDLTIAPEGGFPTSELKIGFMAGWFKAEGALPTQAGKGTIRYPDGKTAEVPLVSAADAFQTIAKTDSVTFGSPLVVTSAALATEKVRTSRGIAEVPVWHFAVKGMNQPVGRVAVSPEAIKPLPTISPEPPDPAGNLVSAQELTSISNEAIDYRLGVGACDEAIKGLVWESAEVVVIGGTMRPPPQGQACTAQLVLHPVKVTLKAPVGSRVVLDAVSGNPVLLASAMPS